MSLSRSTVLLNDVSVEDAYTNPGDKYESSA